MKLLFFFLLLLCVPAWAAPASVTGPIWGSTSFGQTLIVEGKGPRAYCVYIRGSMNVPIESQGYFVLDGVWYATGYQYASDQQKVAASYGF